MAERKTRECDLRASASYKAKHIKRIPLDLNDRTDQDIIAHLKTVGNVQGYIKTLIRKDIRPEE